MFSFCAFPTLIIRLGVEFVLLLVALLVVLPKHRKAGLIMATGAMLDLIVGIGIPVLEMLGLGLFTSSQRSGSSGDSWILVFFLIPMITPLAQAFNIGCFITSVVMLANRLPEEERDPAW